MADTVDPIIEEWRRVRPDLDVASMEVFARLTRVGGWIDGRFAGRGVDRREFDVLGTLRRVGPPYRMTPSELSRSLLAPTGTMTGRLDRLAGQGLIVRLPNPADRRGVIVSLTEEGVRRADALIEALLEEEAVMLEPLSPDDRRALADLLRVLVRSVEDHDRRQAPTPGR